MRSRSNSRRSHGDSYRKRYAVSNVAPPHISSEKQSFRISATPSAPFTMSLVRMRVDSSDWCASRIVVSVIRSFF